MLGSSQVMCVAPCVLQQQQRQKQWVCLQHKLLTDKGVCVVSWYE